MSEAGHSYHPLVVRAVERLTPDAVTISLEVPEAERALFAWRPGQHVNVRAILGEAEVRRSYSICAGPDEAHLRIAVKRVSGGAFSVWANEHLAPGMSIETMPPQGRFVLAPGDGTARHVLALAAGSGITPIIAMARHAMAREPATRFTLVYGNRTPDDIMFREVLEDLKDRHLDRLTLVHVLSRGGGEEGAELTGRIDAALVHRLVGRLVPAAEIADVYLCGPGSMIKDCRNALLAEGLARERVHHEFFAAGGGAYRGQGAAGGAGVEAADAAAAARALEATGAVDVEAILDGRRHRFAARPGESVLDAATRAGVRAPYSCKGGMCSTCRAKIVEGAASMRVNYSLEPWETEQGFVLTCQAVPTSGRLVVDYDQM